MIEASVWFSAWIGHAFLGLDRLVQAVRPAAAGHQATGKFVDDDHFAVLHDVLLVLLEQRQRAQGGIEVMHQGDVRGVVQAAPFLQQAVLDQQLLGMLVAGFGQMNLVALFIDPVITLAVFLGGAGQLGHDILHAQVEVGMVLGLTGNDQRRARLVDQDRIHLVDNGVVQAALDALISRIDHVVAQVVETEFVVGAVGDVRQVGLLAWPRDPSATD